MQQAPYILHYAPDNASLVIRLALEEIGVPYRTQLVDRSANAQRGAAYLALNPHGLIPVLETTDGAIFETAAILLWLADRHGGLAPACDSPARGDALKWLFFLSNTLHPALRRLFYPAAYVGEDATHHLPLNRQTEAEILRHLHLLEARFAAPRPGILLDLYLGPMLRWLALYPLRRDKSWFDLTRYPMLFDAMTRLEARASTQTAAHAEGLGAAPFTRPRLATPPEGTPT